MNKPLSEWTLGEIKQRCDSCCAIPEDCVGCPARRANGDCAIGEPFEYWDLSEPPRWTEQDKEDARKIKAIFPDDYSLDVGRLDDGRLKLVIIQGLSFVLINDELLPSLKPGESVTLDEIIGGGK